MKKHSLLAAAVAGVFLASSALAYTPKESAPKADAPVFHLTPAKVVQPVGLPSAFANKVVNVEFKVDANGQPTDIKIDWVTDRTLKRQLIQAFSQWRFEGDVGAASAAGKRFILPIQLNTEA